MIGYVAEPTNARTSRQKLEVVRLERLLQEVFVDSATFLIELTLTEDRGVVFSKASLGRVTVSAYPFRFLDLAENRMFDDAFVPLLAATNGDWMSMSELGVSSVPAGHAFPWATRKIISIGATIYQEQIIGTLYSK